MEPTTSSTPPPSDDKERKSTRPGRIVTAQPGSVLWQIMTKRSPHYLSLEDVRALTPPAVPAPKKKSGDARLFAPFAFALILVVAALVSPYLPGVPH